MLRLDDERGNTLNGGYRIPFDPRPLLNRLESGNEDEAVWSELWDELYHQGDVGEASYAVVPHLVRIHRARNLNDWNPYAMVAAIELARGRGNNPDVPDWLEGSYQEAIQQMANLALPKLAQTKDQYVVRGILSVLAISWGARTYGEMLLEYSEEELSGMKELDLGPQRPI